MDINHFDVASEIGAASVGESDVKFDEVVFVFINSAWGEYEEELYYDAISGEAMVKELVEAARKVGRLVAKEIKKDQREDLFAAAPPFVAKRMLFSVRASVSGTRLEVGDVVRAFSCKSEAESACGVAQRRLPRRASAVYSRRDARRHKTRSWSTQR